MIPAQKDRSEIEKISGQKSVPVFVDGDIVISETNAIISHLDKKFGNGKTENSSNIYGLEKVFKGTVDEAEAAIRASLKEVGFGVLTYIDVQETLKNKINFDCRPYRILGACNPKLASVALSAEENIGLLLPCNVVVYENAKGETIVSAIKPAKMFSVVNRIDMLEMAQEVAQLLTTAIESLG
jgi:uncharacterized protein (DUF302 family)